MNYFTLYLRGAVLVLVSLLLPKRATAQGPTFDWAMTCASGDGNYGWGPTKLVVDGQGNTYVTGQFNGTIALGATILTATQTYPGNAMPNDVFVAKLDATGAYQWAIQLGDNQSMMATNLAIDSIGDVYLIGEFDSYSLRLGASGPTLYNSSAQQEAFIAKFNGANGQTLWARRAGGTGNDVAGTLATNATGDVYLVVSSRQGADFGPFIISGNSTTIMAKLNSAGTWLWVRALGSGNISVVDLVLDAQGSLYLGGNFRSPSVTFGQFTLSTQDVQGSPRLTSTDVFVAKTNDAGTWAWAVQGDPVGQQNVLGINHIGFDGNGHLYVAGSYTSTGARIGNTILPNQSARLPQPNPLPPIPYTNYYFSDAFVGRLDANTGTWDWAVRNGGTYSESAGDIVADGQDRVYVVGTFDSLTPMGEGTKLAQLDGVTGAWRYAQLLAPAGVQDMTVDTQNRLYVGGYFYTTTAPFGSFTLSQSGPGQGTGYLARLAAGPLATQPGASPRSVLTVWPNPSRHGLVQIQGPKPGQAVQVLDVLGRQVAQGQMPGRGPLALTLPATLPAGVYIVRSAGQAQRLLVE